MDAEESKLPPGIENISRTSMPVQEEFIDSQAEPSIDVSEVICPRCGKPRQEWADKGVERAEVCYCSEECAEEDPS